jgi:hypothetical protein
VGALEGLAQGHRSARYDHQMHVIGHQAVAQEGKIIELRRLPQQLQVGDAVRIVCHNHLAGVAALRNVVGDIYDDHVRQASHSQKIAEIIRSVSRDRTFLPGDGLPHSRIGRRKLGNVPSVPRFQFDGAGCGSGPGSERSKIQKWARDKFGI